MVTSSIDFATATSDGAARRNLLTFPSAFDNAAWTKANATITANAATAPDGTTTADTLTDVLSAGQPTVLQTQSTVVGQFYVYTVYLKKTEGAATDWADLRIIDGSTACSAYFNIATGELGSVVSGSSSDIQAVGDGWFRCIHIRQCQFGNYSCRVYAASANNSTAYSGLGADVMHIWGAQLELGSTATAFQDIGTDEMSVFAGVRKVSDVATGMVLELSASVGSNAGSFYLTAPENTAPNGNFSFKTRGSVNPAAFAASGTILAPTTQVITGQGDISGDVATIRTNGVLRNTYSADQGTGNFGNYQLFLFRRGGTTLPFSGHYYGSVILGRTATATEIANTEKYLAGKTTGVTIP
jgi:hypothetical protein